MAELPWTELGTFWISVVLMFVTVSATMISYLVFRSQVDPEVIVYADTDEHRPTIIILVVENIGKALAKNIEFSLSGKFPQRAFGLSVDNAPVPETMKYGPLISGIPALGPGARRVLTWGQYGGLVKGLGDRVVFITAKYESDRSVIPIRKRHTTVSPIDIRSFEGTDASEKNWDVQAVAELKRIAKVLDYAATGFRPIKIELTKRSAKPSDEGRSATDKSTGEDV